MRIPRHRSHPPPSPPEVSVRVLWPLLRASAAAGIGDAALLGAANLAPEAVRDPDRTLPAHALRAAYERAAELTADPGIGLRAGIATRDSDLGLLHYLVTTSATLREAIGHGTRYLPLLIGGAALELHETGTQARLELHAHGMPPACMDAWIGALLGPIGARLTLDTTPERTAGTRRASVGQVGAVAVPDAIELAHPAPVYAARYRELWGLPVRFDADGYAIVLPRAALDAALLRADAEVHGTLERRAHEALAHQCRASWRARVRVEVAAQLTRGSPDSARVARALGVSRATLTRRLSEENSSFRELTDEVRAELAKRELSRSALAIGEIAYALGFSNTAAFHRAFRRWTRMSPGAYRRTRSAGAV